jgi:urease accessory protein
MTIQSASVHRPATHWPQEEAAGSLTLDFDARHRRRVRMTTDQGEQILLDLPRAIAMADGDGLQLEDGRWLRVQAAPEPVVEIHHSNPHELVRIAWHLGNRHLPTEILHDTLLIRPDHVIEDMLRSLGAELATVQMPFQPEGGAYDEHRHE